MSAPKIFEVVVDSLLSRVPEPGEVRGENDYVLVFKTRDGRVLYYRHTVKGMCAVCAQTGITSPVSVSAETLSEKRAMLPPTMEMPPAGWADAPWTLCPFHATLKSRGKRGALEFARKAGQDGKTLAVLSLLED